MKFVGIQKAKICSHHLPLSFDNYRRCGKKEISDVAGKEVNSRNLFFFCRLAIKEVNSRFHPNFKCPDGDKSRNVVLFVQEAGS